MQNLSTTRKANDDPQNRKEGCLGKSFWGGIGAIAAIGTLIVALISIPQAAPIRTGISQTFAGTTPTSEIPTVSPATPIPVLKSKVIPEDRNIDCLNCGGYALTVKLNTITNDSSHQQTTLKFTITNSGSTSCYVQIIKLEFQDENGTISKAQNEGQYIGDIAVGNPFIVNSTFDLLPRPNIHYLLSTSLRCINELDYKTQDFVFN
jgi:hypothetical protein